MKPTEQTLLDITRVLQQIVGHFPATDDASVFTDIHLRVSADSGEVVAMDDEEHELTRTTIEQWMDYAEDDFYAMAAAILRRQASKMNSDIDAMGIIKPFSIILEDEEGAVMEDIYLADDDTVIISGELMQDLETDLDSFLANLMKEE